MRKLCDLDINKIKKYNVERDENFNELNWFITTMLSSFPVSMLNQHMSRISLSVAHWMMLGSLPYKTKICSTSKSSQFQL